MTLPLPGPRRSPLFRRSARVAALLLAAPFLLLLLGAIVPENRGWRAAEAGIRIHLDGSAVHTELILPVAAAGHSWEATLPLDRFGDGIPAASRIGLSWGERDFFLETPGWSDFSLRRAVAALAAGTETLVHVTRIDGAPSGRPITLSPAEYRRLVDHLEAQIAPGAPLPGYGKDDLFLPARGRYSIARTCNQWTRDALAAAGVRVGRWTPLPQGLLWRFDREDQ